MTQTDFTIRNNWLNNISNIHYNPYKIGSQTPTEKYWEIKWQVKATCSTQNNNVYTYSIILWRLTAFMCKQIFILFAETDLILRYQNENKFYSFISLQKRIFFVLVRILNIRPVFTKKCAIFLNTVKHHLKCSSKICFCFL